MLNGRTLYTLLTIGLSITTQQAQAHNYPEHAQQGNLLQNDSLQDYFPQENPSQDIIVNQLTAGVSSQLRHGPVIPGETLSSITKQRAPKNMSRDRYMDLIFQLNPQAFINQNKNKLKVDSLLTLPGYRDEDNNNNVHTANQRTMFNEEQIILAEYGPLLQIEHNTTAAPFLPQIPIRVIEPNTLNQKQKQAILQDQIQQSIMHEQVTLIQQISQLEQQLTKSQQTISNLSNSQQQLTLKNRNLIEQIQDLHVKYDHIINNYTFSPKY